MNSAKHHEKPGQKHRGTATHWSPRPGARRFTRFATHGRHVYMIFWVPSGELTESYGKWPFIVDFPSKHGDYPLLC